MSSSQEAAASARASTESGSGQPHQLFDAHLRFLNDSYLGLFQERKKIEEQYVDSLQKLHRKYKSIDTWLDDRFDVSTARAAWGEVRDNIDREAEAREAFVASLTTEVISPLISLKDTQERIRKRIREDLKDAITAHTEYEQEVFPKLKRAYFKKAQEVEELRAASNAAPPPTSPIATNDVILPSIKSGQNFQPIRPVVTAPQPLKPLDRRPSQTTGPTRTRSPSTSTALQDLAHQGKRQLNQLMTFLDKGGNKDSAGSRSDNALRAVRAKREADEADKEYRKAVHWLETLRLRRMKMLEGGYNSVESFVHEMSTIVKKVTTKYCDNLAATSVTQTQLCSHARRIVEKISPDKDTSLLSFHIPRLILASTPRPHYYQNFAVGECRDLIFGVSLVDYATAKGLADGEVPRIVRLCIKEIEDRGLDAEGIYRVSGRHASVQELQHKIERNESEFAFHAPQDDVYAVSSLLKLYLRELPEAVFKFPLQDRLQHSEGLEEHASNNFQLLRSKMRRLPPVHQATLKAIVEHLAKVASHQEKNKMDPKNLAIVFGGVIFGEDEPPKGGDLLSVQPWKDTLMEDLINHAHVLFQSSTSSPPLPPAPAGEPVPNLSYGSQHTKITEMPPPPPRTRTPSPSVRLAQPASVPPSPTRPPQSNGASSRPAPPPPADFTPQLPPRPANSIHPSLRAGPLSAQSRQPPPFPLRSGQFFDDDVLFGQPTSPTATAGATQDAPVVSTSTSLKRTSRVPPSPLLVSPWPDSAPSTGVPFPTTASPPLPSSVAPIDVVQEITIPSDEALQSGPSSGTSYASARSPTPSVGSFSGSTGRSPVTPEMLPTALAASDSPNRTSVATISPKTHTKGASSSSE
ncbi:RhoGAP-domain-containing protein [Trametopsis cervina]|nr:RhoGAP-domain-containing protein [Trametopsis cervina]